MIVPLSLAASHEQEVVAADAAAKSSPIATTAETDPIENSVVKVFSTNRYPDVFRPWTKQPPQEVTGSGVVIEGNRILTNAHVVAYASQVQVQASKSGDKVSATVVAISHDIDLAVLELDDASFFDTHRPLPRAKILPGVKDTVMTYGFPVGGTSLSITKGIISRIEFTPYIYPTSGLRIQIDAAINPGNSGGPAVAGDQMIGLAFSQLGNSQNIGYIIPNEEIDLFLADIADGNYDGKPGMYDEIQKLQSPTLRDFLKLDKNIEGVVVHEPSGTASDYPLRKWDVIIQIGQTPVDNEGMVNLGNNLRVRFQYMVQQIVHARQIPLTILRDGHELSVTLPVQYARPMLFTDLKGSYPSYFVYGPLVFSVATSQMYSSFNREGIANLTGMGSPLITRRADQPDFAGEQLVVISSPFFPHKLSKGYLMPLGWVIHTINGISIRNLGQLVEVLRDANSEFITVEFAGLGMESFVFPRKEALKATESILADNDVRSQGSTDTMEIWHSKRSQ
ncbi:MAG: trypsin-like peptidase domain-containing protein [Opitutaceae bacterium]|nr:trypsin-like peptidase domain-containing protein [Opitutaceae bacterium]MBP9911940.1 trypsin-like peptidase domain-containing protein [Opitutaceae bacterium]